MVEVGEFVLSLGCDQGIIIWDNSFPTDSAVHPPPSCLLGVRDFADHKVLFVILGHGQLLHATVSTVKVCLRGEPSCDGFLQDRSWLHYTKRSEVKKEFNKALYSMLLETLRKSSYSFRSLLPLYYTPWQILLFSVRMVEI